MVNFPAKTFVLNPDDWLDAPQNVIDSLIFCNQGDITIDASQSGRVPAQVAQILIAAFNTTKARSANCWLENPTPAVTDSLRALGLSHLLSEAQK